MTRVSQRNASDKPVWTGIIASPVSMFSARRSCGHPRRRGDGAHVNPAAWHFCQKMGCILGAIDRFAYPGLPGEMQLPWWKALAGDH
jgi:hypothetical protein